MSDRYPKLTRVVPTAKTSAMQVAHICLHHYIIQFNTEIYVLIDNGPRFIYKLFTAICGYLEVKHLEITTYHKQTNGQLGRCNDTIVLRPRHYIGESQQD